MHRASSRKTIFSRFSQNLLSPRWLKLVKSYSRRTRPIPSASRISIWYFQTHPGCLVLGQVTLWRHLLKQNASFASFRR
ncbi:hypothetical protein SPRG_18850 [Saprolegnia parasitica CBS 223.65]|uniref:Uncharacterized protein n=1 Tax=Saprolegnia parasitica (strain CBS 223.65) TaxID=695850 RepID=A0A067CYF1_SAPPC|nr:hypothetical protein SPRG_18850 [Saprolegnia parasitica CBS 223.65]KDO35694.1 hypothetical protein SPRG_18850 [Saprolegnia parasitica CBS 223.65]|eukprot:XP_012194066.1 hypothetical protein SPRG_18850 [Saprolegnia parasitica CBS 223.65]